MPKVTLLPGHIQPVWAGHPWIFAQAIARVEGGATAGDTVDVFDPKGNWLGRGLYSPGSAIPVRLYTRDPKQSLDTAFFVRKVERAIERRKFLGLPSDRTNAYRLVHAEGDDLPGLIVDIYGDIAVVQFGTVGMKLRESVLLDVLERTLSIRAIVDRTSERTAQQEGFRTERGVVRGDRNISELRFKERGFDYALPLELGQKTGFYLDQRMLRGRVEQISAGKDVLDTYCFVGSFALAAARGDAKSVVAVDSSALALEVAAATAQSNQLAGKIQFQHEDAVSALTKAGKKGGYDLVICDPPKLSPSRSSKNKASQNLRRVASAAASATRRGGLLVLCSCSASLGIDELTRALCLGARDVGMTARVFERWFQGPDHPVPAAFNEGLYLSTLIAGIDTMTEVLDSP